MNNLFLVSFYQKSLKVWLNEDTIFSKRIKNEKEIKKTKKFDEIIYEIY